MVNKLDEERLCLFPPMKLLMNNLLKSLKELTVPGGILLNHTHTGPLRVVGKALHIISSRTPWRCIVVLKVAMWSKGHVFHHTNPKKASWTLEARGDYWWKPWKKSQFCELNLLQGLPFSYSPTSHPWPSSFGPFLFPSMVPFTKWYPLIGFRAQHFLYLLDSRLVLQCILYAVAFLN